MASEYLRRKYQDVRPDEPPPPMTRKARLANWLHYNKLWIVVWAVVLSVVGGMAWNILGIGQVEPDYIFAYIGDDELPGACAASLETELAALGEDVNGDGRVVVELRQYATDRGGDPETAMYYDLAADVTLIADITEADSYFFIVEDPVDVQLSYQILANPDGSPPADDDFAVDGKVLRWRDCPALAGLAADQELLGGLFIGRRCFYDPKQAEGQEANAALWRVITEGVEG